MFEVYFHIFAATNCQVNVAATNCQIKVISMIYINTKNYLNYMTLEIVF